MAKRAEEAFDSGDIVIVPEVKEDDGKVSSKILLKNDAMKRDSAVHGVEWGVSNVLQLLKPGLLIMIRHWMAQPSTSKVHKCLPSVSCICDSQ